MRETVKLSPAQRKKIEAEKKKVWYQILGSGGVEFRFETDPTGPTKYKLRIRSVANKKLERKFSIDDIQTCPVSLYLQEAQIAFIREFEESVLRQHKVRDARVEDRTISAGQEREPVRPSNGESDQYSVDGPTDKRVGKRSPGRPKKSNTPG